MRSACEIEVGFEGCLGRDEEVEASEEVVLPEDDEEEDDEESGVDSESVADSELGMTMATLGKGWTGAETTRRGGCLGVVEITVLDFLRLFSSTCRLILLLLPFRAVSFAVEVKSEVEAASPTLLAVHQK